MVSIFPFPFQRQYISFGLRCPAPIGLTRSAVIVKKRQDPPKLPHGATEELDERLTRGYYSRGICCNLGGASSANPEARTMSVTSESQAAVALVSLEFRARWHHCRISTI